MSTVILRHPTLPPYQEIEVDKGALPHYSAAGWQQVPDEELAKRAAAKAKAVQEALAAEADAQGEADAEAEPVKEAESSRPGRSRAKPSEKKGEE